MTEQYKCQSYYDNDNILRDCTCGRCGSTDFREQVENSLVEYYNSVHEIPLQEELREKWLKVKYQVAFVDAIDKLHEAEVVRTRAHLMFLAGEIEGMTGEPDRYLMKNDAEYRELKRAAITPKEDK